MKKLFFALVLCFSASNAFAASGTSEAVFQHDRFTIVRIFGESAKSVFDQMKVVETSENGLVQKVSEDGRMYCAQGATALGGGFCWINIDSSSGSVLEVWKK